MTTQPASRPAYKIPAHLGAAAHAALDADRAARDQLGRAMLVTTAAAVRDILTGHEPDAPFDASAVELVEGGGGSLFPTGRYWTLAGVERTFTDTVGLAEAGNGIHGMSEWTAYLDYSNRNVWGPLCAELPGRDRRLAWALDLLRAAALPLDDPGARKPGEMVEVMVCANDRDRYAAVVDPDDQRNGHVRPWFDLDTVRRIAATTQADAAQYGHGSVDTVHVMEGAVDGTAHAVVMVVCWMYLGGEKREQAVEVLQPNADGRYAVGGHDWQWYALDGHLNPQIPFRP
ncbi:hypothetical protein ACIOHS_27130 [Streptomyces sp. NPDC088253]|uniref:hypothetical protein n=1 Tax=Streptomyces sp. NPDC088253 TaxID=3365846 RepID=UPI0037FF8EFD